MARSIDRKRVVLWQARMRRFEQSDLPLAEFCRQEGISKASFYDWRRRLAGQPVRGRQLNVPTPAATPAPEASRPRLVPIVAERTAESLVTVTLACGTRLEVPSHDRDLVACVLQRLLAQPGGRS